MPTSHLNFHKSSYSQPARENCVEVAEFPGGAAVRDTQNRELGHLEFPAVEWHAFIAGAKAEEL